MQLFQFRISQDFGHFRPDTAGTPTIKPPPNAVPLAKPFRKVSPGDTRLGDKQDGIDEKAIVFGCRPPSPFTTRQMPFNQLPLFI